MKQKKDLIKTELNIIPKKISEKQTQKLDQVKKNFNFFSHFKKTTFQFYKEWIKREYKKRNMFLIEMYLRNGKKDTFTITTSEKHFSYKGGLYVIDSDLATHDLHSNLSSLIYHQDCSIPFKLDFNIDNLFEKIQDLNDSVDKALNPRNLKGFIASQVIEKVLKGQELSDDMKFLKMLLIISVLIGFISLVILAKTSGLF